MERITKQIKPGVPELPAKKRVAAYARVSSGKDAMLHSLSAQVSYYSQYIQKNRNWEYVGVYADEALTGTKQERPEFQRLIKDCKAGKLDMIITKSISRLARNTVLLLQTVRDLKTMDIDIFFEKENIHSISEDGEFILTILASFSEEESRSVSDNCKWRIRKQFQKGRPANLRFLYGYHIDKDVIEIVPEEAAIIRMIFNDYINGKGCNVIAKKLNDMNIPHKNSCWSPNRILDIIKNEKYSGNLLLQKKYVKDHISKKLLRNHGALPMYFAEGTHEAIIDTETYKKAQEIMKKRKELRNVIAANNNRYPFSGMITCMQCGKKFKHVINHGHTAWNCSTYLENGKSVCHSKQIPEEVLLSITAKIIGLDKFDEEIFKSRINEMRIPGPNKVIYVFQDGKEIEMVWKDKSRSHLRDARTIQQAEIRELKRSGTLWLQQNQ